MAEDLDILNLSNLRNSIGDDRELEQELFEEFRTSTLQLLEDLAASCQTENNEKWRQTAHALKGIAANLGAVRMAEICRTAQTSAEEGMDTKKFLTETIRAEREKVVTILDAQ